LFGAGDSVRLADEIERAIGDGGAGLLSFGLAGGLEPGLAPGTLVLAREIIVGAERFATDGAWTRRLGAALPRSIERTVAGIGMPAASVAAKAELHRSTGAATVDMESHLAARAAARAGLPVAAIRAIADPAEQALPPAALAGLRRDGRADLAGVMGALARHPAQLPALIAVARNARAALAALAAARKLLGAGFGLPLHPTDA